MFIKEFKVKGNTVKGQLIGNWSGKSYYALKISELSPTTLGHQDLDALIMELSEIRDKIKELNVEHEQAK